jgi:initiation factor 1A
MDGMVRLTRIPGKMRRVRIHDGDIIIVIPWSFQNEKADIIWRYSPPHVIEKLIKVSIVEKVNTVGMAEKHKSCQWHI